jgi:RNA polymerase sigma factor (sigma-70 family)
MPATAVFERSTCYRSTMDEADDTALLERWRAGDQQAGQRLARAYFPKVRMYFVTKAPHIYEELISRTFLRLVEKRDRYQGSSTFQAFVYGIARMILLEYFREVRRDARFDPLTTSAIDLSGDRASTILGKREQHHLLLEALRQLELGEQELLELYYWQQLSGPEIATVIGCKEATVHSRLRRARIQLAHHYRELEQKPQEHDYEDGEIEAWMIDVRAHCDDLRVVTAARRTGMS